MVYGRTTFTGARRRPAAARPAETLEQEAPVLVRLMRFEATGNQAGIVCTTSVRATHVGLMDAERETRG
jgi:hypothetical protein